MGKQAFEHLLGFHGAPLLVGVKPAVLLSFRKDRFEDFDALLASYAPCFRCKGITVRRLAEGEVYVLLLFYRARALARFFFSSARSLECDKQGRFLVPANLRSYAGIALKQTVVLTGTDSRIEVWSKEQWRSYSDEVEPDVAAIAATLADVGI